MILLLMRHGVAEEIESTSDRADARRALTAKGRKRVARMAMFLEERGLRPSLCLASPRRRALQTAEIVAESLDAGAVTRVKSLDFEGSWAEVVADVARLTDGMKDDAVVLAVGHEPSLGNHVTQALVPVHATFPLKKGSVVALSWKGPIEQGNATLLFYQTVRGIGGE